MSGVAGKHLVLFMTRGVTLADWRRIGMLGRELALYRRRAEVGVRVSLVTWGGKADLGLAKEIAPIGVRANRWGLPIWLYRALLPWLHRRTLRACDVVKTNQTAGGLAAMRAARRYRKPLVARCGYMLSQFERRRRGDGHPKTRGAERLEAELFAAATRVQVTTQEMADDLKSRFDASVAARTRVVPNYVDTRTFSPRPESGREPAVDLVFVGRNSPQKNLSSLVEAVRDLPIRVRLIGADGAAEQHGPRLEGGRARAEWTGQLPHGELAEALRGAKAFVLPSLYEGHPKALIEAMACGLAVIVTDRPGLREVVEHGQTGYVCGTDAASLRAAIETVLGDAGLRRRLGRAARADALRRYSLDRVFELEVAVLEEITNGG